LIKFVASLYYTALSIIDAMGKESAKECRRLRNKRDSSPTDTIPFWEADPINGSAKLRVSWFKA